MLTNAVVDSRPTTYDDSPPALICLLGRIGGTGDSADASSAISTAWFKSNHIASAAANSGITTSIDSSERSSSHGLRHRNTTSPNLARSATQKMIVAMLSWSASGISFARFMGPPGGATYLGSTKLTWKRTNQSPAKSCARRHVQPEQWAAREQVVHIRQRGGHAGCPCSAGGSW